MLQQRYQRQNIFLVNLLDYGKSHDRKYSPLLVSHILLSLVKYSHRNETRDLENYDLLVWLSLSKIRILFHQ